MFKATTLYSKHLIATMSVNKWTQFPEGQMAFRKCTVCFQGPVSALQNKLHLKALKKADAKHNILQWQQVHPNTSESKLFLWPAQG